MITNTITDYEIDSLRLMASVAAEGARKLTADRQRQVFLGIFKSLEGRLHEESRAAHDAMTALKAADDAQMKFLSILSES